MATNNLVVEIEQRNGARHAETESDAQAIIDINTLLSELEASEQQFAEAKRQKEVDSAKCEAVARKYRDRGKRRRAANPDWNAVDLSDGANECATAIREDKTSGK